MREKQLIRLAPTVPKQLKLISALTLLLIAEGLLRKLLPPLALAIFFLKDLLILSMCLQLILRNRTEAGAKLFSLIAAAGFGLIPCVVTTAAHDPLLALFGFKQYMLYAVVAVGACEGFEFAGIATLDRFSKRFVATVLATGSLAILQVFLPPGHWLNLSVGGDSLEQFSSGGRLRVASSFAFVAQFCYYLVFLSSLIPLAVSMRTSGTSGFRPLSVIFVSLTTVISLFITGSRTAVMGAATTYAVGGVLLSIVRGGKGFANLVMMACLLACAVYGARLAVPEAFAAYDSRTSAPESFKDGVLGRVVNGLTDWTKSATDTPIFGSGLGLMANGVEKISSYASSIRSNGFWTETDQATVLYEGGMHLMLIWYGLRAWIIFSTLGVVFRIRDARLCSGACFLWGFVAVQGAVGTLSIQAPLAIWWWLAVGILVAIEQLDQRQAFDARPRA